MTVTFEQSDGTTEVLHLRYADLSGPLVYDTVFDFQNDSGLARLFDKATHLVTEFRRNPTEDYNLNFIFKNPMDND